MTTIRVKTTPEMIRRKALIDKLVEEDTKRTQLLNSMPKIHIITDSLIEIENPTLRFVVGELRDKKYHRVNVIYKVPDYNYELQKLINIENMFILRNWMDSSIIRNRNLNLKQQSQSKPCALKSNFLTPKKENIFDFFVDKTTGRNIGSVFIATID